MLLKRIIFADRKGLNMYAIVEIAGKQFKVVEDQKLFVHRLIDKEGSKISFDKVYLLDDGKKVSVGTPAITGASVQAKVVSHFKDDKVIVFKKKRRKGYRVKNGHRQALTELIIEKISASGARAKGPLQNLKEAPTAKKQTKPTAKKLISKKTEHLDYTKLTVAQLKDEAKKKGIEVTSSMKKIDLIAALTK